MIVGVRCTFWLVVIAFYLGLLQSVWCPAYANGGHVHLGGIFFLLLGGLVFIVGTGAIFYLLFRAEPVELEPDAPQPDDVWPETRGEDPAND